MQVGEAPAGEDVLTCLESVSTEMPSLQDAPLSRLLDVPWSNQAEVRTECRAAYLTSADNTTHCIYCTTSEVLWDVFSTSLLIVLNLRSVSQVAMTSALSSAHQH